MLPYQTLKTVRFSSVLFRGESAVRIIFSLSPRPLGTKFDMQALGLEEEKR